MKRTVPLLILIAALAGCDDKDLDSIPRSLATPDLQRAAGNIACRTQEEFEQRADIAIRGTETIVVATGVLSERDIADGKAQLETLGREPMAVARNLVAGQGVDCQSVGQQIVELGIQAARLAR